MLPSCFSTWILSFSVCSQNSKEPAGMGIVAIGGQGCYELWPGFAWKPDQHFPVSELQVAYTPTCMKPVLPVMNVLFLLVLNSLLLDHWCARAHIDVGPPLRDHRVATARTE